MGAHHLVTGEKLGYLGKVLQLTICCRSCGRSQVEPFDANGDLAAFLKTSSCNWCGRLGLMRRVRS